jgi:hypothetical protein
MDPFQPNFDKIPPTAPTQTNSQNINLAQLAQTFVKNAKKFLIKRDVSTSNHPCPADLEVGELALNAVTGKLYTKLTTGKIVMYDPSYICQMNQSDLVSLPGDYKYTLSIPDNCSGNCTASDYGVTMTSQANNSLRFNPIKEIIEGLPQSYNVVLTPVGKEAYTVARISVISDYVNKQTPFQFVLFKDGSYLPFEAKFSPGSYNNGDLGIITLTQL